MIRRATALGPPGIRVRLTLLYTAVFAVLILLFGVAFYTALSNSLASSFDTSLKARAQAIAAGVTFDNGSFCIQDVSVGLPALISNSSGPCGSSAGDATGAADGSSANTDVQSGPQSSVDVGTLVRIADAQRRTIYVSPDFKLLSVPSASITAPLASGEPWTGTVRASTGQDVRLYSAPLSDNGTIYGVMQVGESLAPLESTLRSAGFALGLIAPFVLLLSALGSYAMAGRAFRPITRLTHTARSIEAGDLHERVPVPSARDEVRDLALTLNEMIARLESAFAQQRRFVADASHELRTPVAVIRSLAEVTLAQAKTPKAYAEALRDVAGEAERLGNLVSDLLILARADEGELPIDREPVRLDLLAADVAASVEPLAAERGIALHTEALAPATVVGDAARLIQVVMNLVDNALFYTDAGGEVCISVAVSGSSARLEVRDTGIGIAPEDVPHIFERFYRADPVRSRMAGNSGLGLAIVDWVVRAHAGSVDVASQPGHGSTFAVTLPLAGPAARAEGAPTRDTSSVGGTAQRRR